MGFAAAEKDLAWLNPGWLGWVRGEKGGGAWGLADVGLEWGQRGWAWLGCGRLASARLS